MNIGKYKNHSTEKAEKEIINALIFFMILKLILPPAPSEGGGAET
jgi:hypothetical protein